MCTWFRDLDRRDLPRPPLRDGLAGLKCPALEGALYRRVPSSKAYFSAVFFGNMSKGVIQQARSALNFGGWMYCMCENLDGIW